MQGGLSLNRFKKWQIGLTVLTSVFYFFYYFGRYNYSPTIPFIKAEFGLSNTAVGLIATTLTAGYAVGQFINGFLIDRYGPRLIMTIGGFLSTFANFGMAISGSFSSLITAWGLNGYVQAMGYGSCCKLYSNWFKPEERGKPLGFNEFLQSFASTAIVPLGALIIMIFGWRFVYVFPVVPLIFVSVIFYILGRNYPEERGFPTQAVHSIGVVKPKNAYRKTLSDWRMVASYLSYGGSQFGRFAIYTWVPAYIFSLTGNIIKAGWVTAAFAIGGSIGSLVIGWLSDIIKKRSPLIFIGMVISALSLFVFAIMPQAPVLTLSVLMAICGSGIEAVEVCYFLLPMDILDLDGLQATGVGTMNAFGKAFATFQGVLFGLLLDLFNFKASFIVTGVICLLAAFLVVPIRK